MDAQRLRSIESVIGFSRDIVASHREVASAALGRPWTPSELLRARSLDDAGIERLGAAGDALRVVLAAGDVLVRRAVGARQFDHLAVLAAPALKTLEELRQHEARFENAGPGLYALVIEGGAFPHRASDDFWRRVLDLDGRVSDQQILLRPDVEAYQDETSSSSPCGCREPYLADSDAEDAPAGGATVPPTVKQGVDANEIIVTRADGTRFHVRRKIRGEALTNPGRARLGFCKDDQRVFARLSWCKGTQGTIDLGANPQQAFKQLMEKVIDQISRGEDLDRIKQTFEKASLQTFLDVDIARRDSWSLTGGIQLEMDTTGITSATGKLSVARPWFTVGVEARVGDDEKRVLVTVEVPLSKRKITAKKCPDQELMLWWDVECLREVPRKDTLPSPGMITKTETLYVYFEYAQDTFRSDSKRRGATPSEEVDEILRSEHKSGTARLNRRQFARLDYLIRQGYWVTQILGYASPEGRRKPPAADARGADANWEGNILLSGARAEKVKKLIAERYSAQLLMRPRARLPAATPMSEHPLRDKSPRVELEGAELDRLLIVGDDRAKDESKKVKPFLDDNSDEQKRMTDEDRTYVTDRAKPVRMRAERLFQNLRRVEIKVEHTEEIRGPVVDSYGLTRETNCAQDVVEAAERQWGSRIPFTKPDPPLCG